MREVFAGSWCTDDRSPKLVWIHIQWPERPDGENNKIRFDAADRIYMHMPLVQPNNPEGGNEL